MSNGDVISKTPEELEKEKKAERKKKALTAGGFLSLLPSIGGAIPGLLKSKQRGALKDMQAGRGAGAQAARAAASEAGRRTAGNLGGRGSSGLVRAGIASAERQTAIGAREAGRIGAQEGITGTALLLAEEQRRRQQGLKLGAGIGGAFSGALGLQTAALDQGPAGEEVAGALTQAPVDLASPELGPGLAEGAPQGTEPGLDVRTNLRPPDVSLEQVAGSNLSPEADTQLAQPMETFDLNRPAFALQAILDPEQNLQAAAVKYQETAIPRKSERPLSSKGGSDANTRVQQTERERFHLVNFLNQEVLAGRMLQEEADIKLLTFDKAQGPIIDFLRMGEGGQ
jgi:hypothetical protein